LPIDELWVSTSKLHSHVADKILKISVPFSTTYLCEMVVSLMLAIKNERGDCLDLQ